MCVPLSAECSAAALALCDIRCDIVITFKESTQAAAAVLGAGGWGAHAAAAAATRYNTFVLAITIYIYCRCCWPLALLAVSC
jgi:hypothetical protein